MGESEELSLASKADGITNGFHDPRDEISKHTDRQDGKMNI